MTILNRLFHVFILISIIEINFAHGGLLGLCVFWEHECPDGECISSRMICDGKNDCKDGSDEKNCQTTTVVKESLKPYKTIKAIRRGSMDVISQATAPSTVLSTSPNKGVKFQCGGNYPKNQIRWYRAGHVTLPPHSSVKDGFLILRNVTCGDSGEYICYNRIDTKKYQRYGKHLVVEKCEPIETTVPPILTSVLFLDPTTTPKFFESQTPGTSCCKWVCLKQKCHSTNGPVIDHFQCSNCSYTPKTSRCDGVKDCPDGFDEIGCTPDVGKCNINEFQCKNGKCISFNEYCDGEIDCEDGSDEKYCTDQFPPKITELPKDYVEVECSNDEEEITARPSELHLTCSFVGNPVPIVRWKKYEGLVPTKCFQSSYGGYGSLRCPDFQQSDQGAYSCIADNLLGSAESQPKSVVKCSRITCNHGFIVTDKHDIKTCLKCFCSGKDVGCSGIPSNPIEFRIKYPTATIDLLVDANGGILLPNSSSVINSDQKRVKYFSVPEYLLQGQPFLRSYGRHMNIPLIHEKTDFVPQAPDIVIRGNGLSLSHSFHKIFHKSSKTDVRFWKGNWNHADGRIATRSDIMKVLSNLDMILFRGEFQENKIVPVHQNSEIVIQSSTVSDRSDSLSYLEKCNCPKGYSGLSCEVCAPGFERDLTKSEFTCNPMRAKPKFCSLGEPVHDCKCDMSKLHYVSRKNTCELAKCNEEGSLSIFPDDNDNCLCKEGVTGKYCDHCKDGYFYLNKFNAQGCKKCWCNNLSTKCSSFLGQKTTISSGSWGGYNSSAGENYWLLPKEFTGNKLTSYGGFLDYILQFTEESEENRPLSVEILNGNNSTLRYVNSNVSDVKGLYRSEKVLIEEPFWRDENGLIVSREKLMVTLVNVQAIYIQSPYHLSSKKVKLMGVSLEVAEEMSNHVSFKDEYEIAEKVEKCDCPVGYTGLSCESCQDGYYKERTENGGFFCKLCDCQNCDPERGCSSCKKDEYRDNPEDSKNPICRQCPCNGNQEYCLKDQLDQVLCFCKTGYSGLYCNNSVSQSHLKVIITPLRVIGKEIGTIVTFNCTYDSTDEMNIKFDKVYSVLRDPINFQDFKKIENVGASSIMEIAIEENLMGVHCIVSDKKNIERGRVTAHIVGSGKPKIKPQINCYNEAQKVIENEDLQLICEATGEPKPEITWYIKKNHTSVEVETINGVHSITSAKLDLNETVFVCVAKNIAGDDKCSTQVFVKKRCDIISISPQNLIVYEHEVAEFVCSITSKAPVRWYSSYYRSLPTAAEVHGGKLVIKDVNMDHGGIYICTANSTDGNLEASVELTVILKKLAPKAVIVEEDMMVRVGKTVVVNCDVSGQPEPTVRWNKIGKFWLPANVVMGNNNRRITLSNVNVGNQGFYECIAESELGNSSSVISILVNDIPEVKVEPEHIVAKTGDSVTVNCILLQGDPVDELYWVYDDGNGMKAERIDGNKLQFSNVSSSNSKIYTCIAKNVFGMAEASARITVGEKPSVKMFPEGRVTAVVGDSFDITCEATGEPQPTIKWFQKTNRQGLFGKAFHNPIRVLNETGTKLSVTITQETSKIMCEASNVLGKANKNLTFEVQGGTGTTSGTVQRAHLGEKVQITFPDLNDVVKCRRNDSGLLGDECYIKDGLEISSVQVQHSGVYICKSATGKESRKKLVVVGFVQKFEKKRKSFLILPITVRSSNKFDAEITFKADNATGLLLQKRKDHGFSMYLMNSRLFVKLRSENSSVLILKSRQALELHVWYTAVFKLGENAELTIYDDKGSKLEFESKPVHFLIDWTKSGGDDLYLGGVTFSGLHLPLRWNDIFFAGCVSRLIVEDHEYQITAEGKYSKNVLLCYICSSKIDPCGSEGICYDAPTQYGYVCACGEYGKRCPQSCYGVGCQTKLSMCEVVKPCGQPENKCTYFGGAVRCQCASGFSGLNCGNDELNEFSLDGTGYVKLPHHYLPRRSFHEAEHIKINFTSTEEGLLLYQSHGRNFLLIKALKDGLSYEYENQGTRLSVVGDFDNGPSHRVVIIRRNNTVEMDLDGHVYQKKVPFRTNRVKGDIYIGGVAKELEDNNINLFGEVSPLFKGFKGCIHSISLGKSSGPINILAKDIKRQNFQKYCNQYFSRKLPLSDRLQEDVSESEEDTYEDIEDD